MSRTLNCKRNKAMQTSNKTTILGHMVFWNNMWFAYTNQVIRKSKHRFFKSQRICLTKTCQGNFCSTKSTVVFPSNNGYLASRERLISLGMPSGSKWRISGWDWNKQKNPSSGNDGCNWTKTTPMYIDRWQWFDHHHHHHHHHPSWTSSSCSSSSPPSSSPQLLHYPLHPPNHHQKINQTHNKDLSHPSGCSSSTSDPLKLVTVTRG